MALSAITQGAALGASMIIPIGVQNSFILSQGIRRNYHYLTATVCLMCDVFLTTLGVFGTGKIIASNELLLTVIGWGGILFLVSYASISFHRAWRCQYGQYQDRTLLSSSKAVIVATLAVTLLNPHVYLDTVVILGSVGSTFSGEEKLYFTLGAILAATVWFYGLAGGAAKLSPWLSKPRVQQYVDTFVGVVMCFVALKLFNSILV